MKTYKTLHVWQKSVDLVEAVYEISLVFPDDERFGLTSQIRRSAVSIPSNIAEGHGRKSDGEFVRFLKVAFGSSSELETQLIIAERLELINKEKFEQLEADLAEIRMMLNKLISSLLSAKD